MSIELDELYPYRHSLVNEFFIKTADDNYVNARWCFEYGLDVDFFWLAAHCLEKYLKAALLLNGRSAKRYGHDITSLYPEVRSLAPELLPAQVETPGELENGLFGLGTEPVEEFVRRMYFYGQPDNRYQMIGYTKREADLLKLDQLVFAVRRLCQPLESHFMGQQHKGQAGVPDETRRERMLRDDPSSRNLYSNLEKVISGERGRFLRRIALNWNFSFAPPEFKHGRMRLGFRMVTPVTVLRFLDPLDKGTAQQDKHADELWEWATENIYFPSDFRKLYEAERKRRKDKAREARKS